jgi:hypothetical protein
MKKPTKLRRRGTLLETAAVLIGCLAALATGVRAQNAGNNDVYSSSGGQTGSTAFIDAYVFLGSGGNVGTDGT